MKFWAFVVLSLFLIPQSWARVAFDVSYFGKKDIGGKPFVTNQKYEHFYLLQGEKKIFQLAHDFKLIIEAKWDNKEERHFDLFQANPFGPLLTLESKIYKKKGKDDFLVGQNRNWIRRGEKARLEFKDQLGHKFEIHISPSL